MYMSQWILEPKKRFTQSLHHVFDSKSKSFHFHRQYSTRCPKLILERLLSFYFPFISSFSSLLPSLFQLVSYLSISLFPFPISLSPCRLRLLYVVTKQLSQSATALCVINCQFKKKKYDITYYCYKQSHDEIQYHTLVT